MSFSWTLPMQASQSLPPSPKSLSACCSLPVVIGPDQYTIAIICAMPKEFDPVRALFDDGVSFTYHNHGSREDNNIYIVGRFANHHTVLMMPGDVGELDAGMCAQRLRSHFSNIELTLLVGICGAMPQKEADEPIYLGDVIVGTSVWRYLHAARSSQLEYRGVNLELRNLVAEGTSERARQLGNLLKTEAFREEIINNGLSHMEFLQRRQGGDKYKYPGHENDKLFKSNCLHRHRPSDHQCSCADPARSICKDAKDTLCKDLGCEKDGVERVRAETKQPPPSIHVGTIASADIVMRARSEFDTGFKDRGVIGVDMEGGGVSHATDCIVIKGAVDYADTHKNQVFAHYAAAAAASIAKAILMILYRGNTKTRENYHTSTSSLSVAGSAIQLVDFSLKLWSRIRELCESESEPSSAYEKLRTEANRLCDLNLGLRKLLAPGNLQRSLTLTEQNVVALCAECGYTAKRLAATLEELSPKRDCEGDDGFTKHDLETETLDMIADLGQRKRKRHLEKKWHTVRVAMMEIWMRRHVHDLCQRVKDLKQSLATTIFANIQYEVDDSRRKIQNFISKGAKWDSAKSFKEWLQSKKFDAHQCQVNLLNAAQSHGPGDPSATPTWDTLSEHPKLQPWSTMSKRIIGQLIMTLSFNEMFDRQERIPDSFEDTFQWIYSEPQDPQRPWDGFSSWLTQGRGIYWITGKPGSGKSTMMRMLQRNPHTDELLREWSQGNPLIMASFFFWNSGSILQMSQEGLLRSILKQALEKRLPHISEQLTRKLEAFSLSIKLTETIRFKELQQLFRLLIEEDDEPVKYFFLLDGLDEVDGNQSSLVSLVHTLGTYPNVKICVSSRPGVVFEDGFQQQPSLMLQFLTYGDILHYAREKLTNQPAFRELEWGSPESADELLKDVTTKASGVFLWVILAVGSLIKGLADGDRVEDLKRRLDEIPEELEELFNKMLHGLKGRYFTDAARIFRIHRASKEMQLGFSQGLPLLALAFAEESTFNSAVEWPFKPLTGKEWLMRSITMKRRLSSRCNGLLEIEDPRRTSGEIWDAKDLDRLITDAGTGDPSVLPTLHAYGRALARTTVQYLHRTVKDYLEAPETWRSIERAAAKNQPCPRTSLCLAHIILWKTFDRGASIADSQQTFKTLLEQCFESAFALSINDRNAHVQILDAIGASIFHEDSVAMVWNRLKITHPLENFLCFSVHCNFSDYVQAKLAILKPRDLARQCSRLLRVVVSKGEPLINVKGVSDKEEEDCESEGSDEEVWVGYRGPGGGPPVSMVEMLLRHHANPDHVIDGVSSRQIVMKRISDLRGMNPEDNGYLTFTLNRILRIFEGRSKQKNISRSRGRKAKRLSK